MKVLQICPHYRPAVRYGGPQSVAHGLGRSLARTGNEVVVCTTNLQDETSKLNVPLDRPVNVDGVYVYYEQVRIFRYWGFSLPLYRRIEIEMRTADIVIVHAHYQFANWVGAYLARRLNKPYAIFAHSSLHRSAVAHSNQRLKHLYLSVLEDRNLHEAAFIAFNAVEESEHSLYSERGVVIPSGVDEDEFTDLPDLGLFRLHYPELKNKTILLFLGRLDIQQKGLDLLLPAFAHAVSKDHSLHLVLAGPDEDNAILNLRKMIEELGILQNVTFTGLISGVLKKAALQDSDVFVLPSRFEGLSIALLEALYVGLPVLVTDRVGLHQTISQLNAGIVVEPDVNSIAQAIISLSDPQVRLTMQGRAIPLVRNQYTWDAITERLLTLMSESRAS